MIVIHDTGLEYRGKQAYHLVSTEGIEELHAFARKLGLHRDWFQDKPRHPHYDVFGFMVKRARDLGAVEVTGREYVEIIRNRKKEQTQ